MVGRLFLRVLWCTLYHENLIGTCHPYQPRMVSVPLHVYLRGFSRFQSVLEVTCRPVRNGPELRREVLLEMLQELFGRVYSASNEASNDVLLLKQMHQQQLMRIFLYTFCLLCTRNKKEFKKGSTLA